MPKLSQILSQKADLLSPDATRQPVHASYDKAAITGCLDNGKEEEFR